MITLCTLMGAHPGKNPRYQEAAIQLGQYMAENQIRLVYGGGQFGLMGTIADTMLAHGGEVIGVITSRLLTIEGHRTDLSELHIVETMQERKKLLAQYADGFIAFPGGLGTLEEIFEIWNAIKLSIYNKPLGLLNIDGFYNKLIEFVKLTVEEQFLKQESLDKLTIHADPITLLNAMFKLEPALYNPISTENILQTQG